MLLRGTAQSRLRVFPLVFQKTAVAISGRGMPGAREMHNLIARIADIEIPVWRRHNRNYEFIAPITLAIAPPQ